MIAGCVVRRMPPSAGYASMGLGRRHACSNRASVLGLHTPTAWHGGSCNRRARGEALGLAGGCETGWLLISTLPDIAVRLLGKISPDHDVGAVTSSFLPLEDDM